MTIQRDNAEQVQNERQRVGKLDEEMRAMRDAHGQLQLEKQAAVHEGGRLQAEMAALGIRIQEAAATISRVEGEREVHIYLCIHICI